MKKPFTYALGAAGYVALIVVVMHTLGNFLQDKPDNILMPMAALSLFVLSAAVMGFFFLSEPLYLITENKKKEALSFFGKVVGIFACFVILFTILIFLF